MYASDYLKIGLKGHINFDFLDIFLNSDNKLFIDPCLIENSDEAWHREASLCINSFFNKLFNAYRAKGNGLDRLYNFAHEKNATKLGYGNGDNGKGKTVEGLHKSLYPLYELTNAIPTINKAQDITTLIRGFDKDNLSDLITNIIHSNLNDYTSSQMIKYNRKPDDSNILWTWDHEKEDWIRVIKPFWLHNGKELLLVPKNIVRKNYLFKARQYLYAVIINRIREANDWSDLTKADIYKNMKRDSKHWLYDQIIDYTINQPDALLEYHSLFPKYYNRKYGCMSDDQLDDFLYKGLFLLSA